MKGALPFAWLFLLVPVLWNSSASQKVHVQCGPSWIQVRIEANIYDQVYARPEELFLGEGCPVTKDLNDSYEFFYTLPQCDIETTELIASISGFVSPIVSTSMAQLWDFSSEEALNNMILPGNTIQHKTKITYFLTAFNNQIEIPVSCLSPIQVTLIEVQRKEDFLKTAFNLESKRKVKDARLGKREVGEICFSRWLRNLNMYHWIIPMLVK